MSRKILFFLVIVLIHLGFTDSKDLFRAKNGKVSFRSEASLEIIEASSNDLSGIIDATSRRFAFAVPINSFFGFNNPLQKEHFNENYMESKKYSKATFEGKIIEDIDFSKDGDYTVRAKGSFNVHGVAQERIIKSRIIIADGKLEVSANFIVLVREHNIKIPKIVNQKIAKEILVKMKTTFERY